MHFLLANEKKKKWEDSLAHFTRFPTPKRKKILIKNIGIYNAAVCFLKTYLNQIVTRLLHFRKLNNTMCAINR